MTTRKKETGKGKTVKEIVRREGPVLFLLASVAAGAATFCVIVGRAWDIEVVTWVGLIIAASVIGLPKVYTKLKDSRDPWLVRFACAFREGFLSLPLIAPDLSGWATRMREMWRNLNRKP